MEAVAEFVTWLQRMNPAMKVAASALLMAMATFSVAVIWQRPVAAPPPSGQSPAIQSIESLKYIVERTSPLNRKLLLAILNAGPDSVYIMEAAKTAGLTRDEAHYRAKDLAAQGLIEIQGQTDYAFRIHNDVYKALGPNGQPILKAMLQ